MTGPEPPATDPSPVVAPRVTRVLTTAAVIIALLGGVVPGIAHQVEAGHLPAYLQPERYLGPPYAGSISGSLALAGAAAWSIIAIAGMLVVRRSRRATLVLLGVATLITVLINVALPASSPNSGVSTLGLAQTACIVAALVAASVHAGRADRSRPAPAAEEPPPPPTLAFPRRPTELSMYRFLVLYETPEDPEGFERHYWDVHIPLAHRLPGLRRYTVSRDVRPVRGGDPLYLVGELDWDDAEALAAAFASPEGRATAADMANLGQYCSRVRSMTFQVEDTATTVSAPA